MSKPLSDLARRVQGDVEPGQGLQALESLAANLTKAEIDQQIATAKKYPRQITAVQKAIEQLACLDQETADECFYRLKRSSNGESKDIIGPSIRFAEIVMQSWGNCRVAARITNEGRRSLEATGIYHDLETNMAVAKSLPVRITKSNGDRYGDDMVGIAGAAGTSKALRNAILAGVPKGVWNKGYKAALAVSRGDVQTLGARRQELIAKFKPMGIPFQEVFEVLGVGGLGDITLDLMLDLRALHTTLATAEDTWANILEEHRAAKAPPAPAQVAQTAATPPADDKPREGFSKAHVDKETDKPPADKTPAEPQVDDDGVIQGEVVKGDVEPDLDGSAEDEVSTADADLDRLNAVAAERAAEARASEIAKAQPIEKDPRPAAEGFPAKGEQYWVVGEDLGDDKKWPTFKDGKPASRVGIGGVGKLKLYFDHPPVEEVAPPVETPPKVEPPAQTATTAAPREDEIDPDFWPKVAASESWLQIKALTSKMMRTTEWGNLADAEQRIIRGMIWAEVERVKADHGDRIDFVTDVSAFRLWMDTSRDHNAIQGNFRVLIKEEAWGKVNEGTRVSVTTAVTDRVEELKG